MAAHLVRLSVGCALAVIPVVAAQQPAPIVQQPAAIATASVSGAIVADDAAATPIPRAVVTLTGQGVRRMLVVVADDNGRFTSSNLGAGRLTVTAARTGYLTMSYGQKTPGKGTGVPISVAVGQQITGIVLKLPKASSISGRVVNELGQPVRGAPLIVQLAHTIDGERAMSTVNGTSPVTDAQGFYRADGLAPGEYFLCAFPADGFRILIPDLYRPTGLETHQIEAAEMQWALQQLRGANSAAPSTAVPGQPAPAPPPAGPAIAYGPVYYPDTPNPAVAAAVAVGLGEGRSGIDIRMAPRRTARIEGRVVGADGQPATNVSISIRIGSSNAGSTSPDGRFSVTNLLPGKVGITAQLRANGTWASTDVDVNGQDVTGLVLTLQPAATFSGRVAFEATTLQPPSDLTAVRLTIRPSLVAGLPVSLAVGADGTFRVPTIIPGSYRLMTTTGPGFSVQAGAGPDAAIWRLKSLTIGGRDVDVAFDVGAGGVSDAVFTFTDRATELTGTLVDAAGQPASGYYIVAFSTDKRFWRQGARQLPTPARSSNDGQYRVAGLPPGTYYIAAVEEFDPADLADEAFLTRLIPAAIQVTLGDGEKKTQGLRMGR